MTSNISTALFIRHYSLSRAVNRGGATAEKAADAPGGADEKTAEPTLASGKQSPTKERDENSPIKDGDEEESPIKEESPVKYGDLETGTTKAT